MTTKLINIDRMFQLWEFKVSHGLLLLRSTRSSQQPSRIDICFKNVNFIELPSTLPSLTIMEACEDKSKIFLKNKNIEIPKGSILYNINDMFYVVAGYVGSHEDELEYYEDSYFVKNNQL